MSAVSFHFPSQEALRTHAMEWSAQTTKNGFKTLLQTVWIVHSIYYICILNALLPSVILSYMKNNSTYCFSFFVHEKKKKDTYLPSTVPKNSPWSEPAIISSLPTKYNTRHKSLKQEPFVFTPDTFVLSQMCPSPSPMLSHAYFGALRRL